MPRDVHDLNNKEKIPSKGRIVQLLDPIIGPPGIPVREFPGIWHCQIPGGNSREFCENCDRLFFPVISLFVQYHYHLHQTLSVNYNVLSIKLPTVKEKKTEIGLHV